MCVVLLLVQLLPSDEKDIFAFAGFFSVTRTKTPAHSESASLTNFPSVHKQMHKQAVVQAAQVAANRFQRGGAKHKRVNGGSINGIDIYHNSAERAALFEQLKDSRYRLEHTAKMMLAEYRRLGWSEGDASCPLRVTTLNENYKLCPTYPKLLLVPRTAKDIEITEAAKHRSRNRLPAITWINSYNVCIARSSQPQSGVNDKRYGIS